MRRNRGQTSLKRKRRAEDPMRDYDRLPPAVRFWLAQAVLPWRPRSAYRAYNRAFARTRDESCALAELDRLQDRLIAKDAQHVWGQDHPNALQEAAR